MSNHITLSAGEKLFSEGEAAASMFVITEGRIEVRQGEGASSQAIAELGPGEFIGELSILNNEPRSATCVAIEESVLMVYDADSFERLIETRPTIALRIIKSLAERLRETTTQLRKLSGES